MTERKSPAAEPLTVVAPLIVVTIEGGRRQELSAGDVVPDGVTPECLAHLRAIGFIS